MILSSADILRILGGDPVIRQEARLSIVDNKPGIGLDEFVYIYVQRYPATDEYEATWKIWVQDGGSEVLDLVLAAMTRLLPNFDYHGGHYSTRDFKTARTETEPAPEDKFTAQDELDARFKLLSDSLLKKINGLRDGEDGLDGLPGPQGVPGRDGTDGKDGKDLEATDTALEDLKNVEPGIAYEKGQVLTWDGEKWTNLFIPQVMSAGRDGGGAGGSGSGLTIDDVRLDAEDTTFSYDVEGKLVSTTGAEVQKTFTYDVDGVLETVTITSNGTSITKTFSYDVDGNLSSVTVT